MSKLEIPLLHDHYAKWCIMNHVLDLYRHHLDLPDPDDEMRDEEGGLDVSFDPIYDSWACAIKVTAHKANGEPCDFTHRQYHDIMQAMVYVEQELPNGFCFFEIYTGNSRTLDIRYAIDHNDSVREWYNFNIKK
jgi:hypothetical protein